MSIQSKLANSRARKMYKAFRTRRELRKLTSDDDQAAKSVGLALQDVLGKRLSDEEQQWIGRIEALRAVLNASPREVTLTDFGAGSAELSLSADEMYEGRVVTRTLAEISMGASKYPLWSLALFKLIRHLRPSRCLELGTSIGISGAYYGAALELNDHGNLLTLEGAESLAEIARSNFEQLGIARVKVNVGRFQDTLDVALREQAPIGYAFVDGLHERDATIGFFRAIVPFLEPDAVVVFDDITWSAGMREAWQAIRADDAVRVDVDLGTIGLCIVRPGSPKRSFDLSHFPQRVEDARLPKK